jgi:WbqC-like protein
MPGLTCAIHQPNFFPRLSTLAKLYAADVWVILDDVQFSRRDYQHRCYLPPAGTTLPARWLTVPVHLPAGRATLIKDVLIADPDLAARHVRGLLRQYFRNSPHQAEIAGLLADAGDAVASSATVAEASERTTIALLKAVGWQGRICRSRDIAARAGRSERLADLAISAGATTYLCGTGGSRYLNPAPFAAQGLDVRFFTPPARLATLPPDACRRATALADLAEAGPRTLARHLDCHAPEWRNRLHVAADSIRIHLAGGKQVAANCLTATPPTPHRTTTPLLSVMSRVHPPGMPVARRRNSQMCRMSAHVRACHLPQDTRQHRGLGQLCHSF